MSATVIGACGRGHGGAPAARLLGEQREVERGEHGVELWGGSLCVDFVNSVDYDAEDRPLAAHEALHAPGDLGRWARRLGVSRGRALLKVSDDEFAAAPAMRADLYAVLAAVAREERPPEAALARVMDAYAKAAATARLPRDDGPGAAPGWRLDWPARDQRRVRFAVATDAVALLGDPPRLAASGAAPAATAAGCSSTRAAGGGGARWARAGAARRCAGCTPADAQELPRDPEAPPKGAAGWLSASPTEGATAWPRRPDPGACS